MRRSIKAIFIVSVLFIIGVGLFGIIKDNITQKEDSLDYHGRFYDKDKVDEINGVINDKEAASEQKGLLKGTVDSKEEKLEEKIIQEDVQQEEQKVEDTQKTEETQYMERLNSIVNYYEQMWSKSDTLGMTDMKELKNQEYKKWDDELNTIYQMIKKKMPKEEFALLRQEELNWITSRDEQAALAADKYAGGTMESLEYISVMTNLTKQRTYELVEIYFAK